MQIKHLEDEIGLPLFEQVGKKIHLTEAGRQTLNYAKNVLQELNDLNDAVNELKGIRGGQLRLAVANSLSSYAAKLIAPFLKRHPEIDITLEVSNRQQQIRELTENHVDLAIMGEPPHELGVVAEPLLTTHILALASPRHPLASQQRISLITLNEQKFIYGESGSGTRVALDHSLDHRHIEKSHIEVSNNEMVKYCIEAGLGVGLLPEVTVTNELANGRLVSLNVANFPIPYQVNLVHLKQKRLSVVAKAFQHYMNASAEDELDSSHG
jgi:DNA-binding transcriptional LysR family regulator